MMCCITTRSSWLFLNSAQCFHIFTFWKSKTDLVCRDKSPIMRRTRGEGGATSHRYLPTRNQSGLVWMRLCIGTSCKQTNKKNINKSEQNSCVCDPTQPELGPDYKLWNLKTQFVNKQRRRKRCVSKNEDLCRPAVSSNGGEVCAGIKPACNPCSLSSESNEWNTSAAADASLQDDCDLHVSVSKPPLVNSTSV